MLKTRILWLAAVLASATAATAAAAGMGSGPLLGDRPGEWPEKINGAVSAGRSIDEVFRLALLESTLLTQTGAEGEESQAEPAEPQASEAGKSPRKAGLLSLIYPGAGQIYAGAKTRGWIMVGLETAFWVSYFYHNGQGKSKEEDYQAYADEHYDRARYKDFLAQDIYPWIPEGTVDGDFLRNNFFLLPEDKNQQYYEDIGKYDKYVMGWSGWWGWYNEDGIRGEGGTYDWLYWNNWDSSDGIPFPSDETRLADVRGEVDVYKDMRFDSNAMFKRAKLMVGLSLFHRVFAVIDAIRLARLSRGETMASANGLTSRVVFRSGQPTLMVGWNRSF